MLINRYTQASEYYRSMATVISAHLAFNSSQERKMLMSTVSVNTVIEKNYRMIPQKFCGTLVLAGLILLTADYIKPFLYILG